MNALTAAHRTAEASAGILGGAIRSVILHGSLTAGDFRSGRSDIDLLVVVDGEVTAARAGALEQFARTADLGGAAGLDLHVVTAEVARSPGPAPALELHIGRYDRSSIGFEVERRTPAAPDLPAELSMARADGRALVGPAPSEVIGPVPARWLVDRGRHWLTVWQSSTHETEDAAFMALTACRMWHFALENVHASKAGAARWALARDPSLVAVRQALHQHDDDPTALVDEPALATLLARVQHDLAVVADR